MVITSKISKSFLIVLPFLQPASTQGICSIPPPDVKPIPCGGSAVQPPPSCGHCITTYSPIPWSCDNLGSWEIPNPFYEGTCRNRGCLVVPSGNQARCLGTPCCSYDTRNNPSLCNKSEPQCTCNPGFELLGGKCEVVCPPGWKRDQGVCEEIICEGDHALNETWGRRIQHGLHLCFCFGRGDVHCSYHCDPGFCFSTGELCHSCWDPGDI